MEAPLTTNVEVLAFNRFIYDFSGHHGSLSTALFQSAAGSDGVNAAFKATSLTNFHRRSRDTRALNLATKALGRALTTLGHSLESGHGKVTLDLAVMALLLGLHQNISRDEEFIGSWAYHLRGSLNLVEAAADNGFENAMTQHLKRVQELQALYVSLRVGIAYPAPARMRKALASKTDLRSRNIFLGARVADYCAHVRTMNNCSLTQTQLELSEQSRSLNTAFDTLGTEFRTSMRYLTLQTTGFVYPAWYQVISTAPGGPTLMHSYAEGAHAEIWNTYRMARMSLYRSELSLLQHEQVSSTQEQPATAKGLSDKISQLVHEVCASVFWSLTYRTAGAKATDSFEDVPGARAYMLISPLGVARECARTLPDSSAVCAWIENVQRILEERLGISEAFCWKDGDEVAGKARIEQTLKFDDD